MKEEKNRDLEKQEVDVITSVSWLPNNVPWLRSKCGTRLFYTRAQINIPEMNDERNRMQINKKNSRKGRRHDENTI